MATGTASGSYRPVTSPSGSEREYRLLQVASLVYVAGLIAHTADHVRRGTDVITREVFWAGIVSTSIGVIVVILIFGHHRLAPLFGAAFGFFEAIGVTSAHLVPHWSALSDSFIGHQAPGITSFSWFVVLLEVAGALGMGIFGWLALRRSTTTTAAAA